MRLFLVEGCFKLGILFVAGETVSFSTIESAESGVNRVSWMFDAAKRTVDIGLALLLLSLAALFSVVLLLINPFFNRGPLFFIQERMGKDLHPFKLVKFRTMTSNFEQTRSADCPLEVDRITPLGRWLRRLRIDEFPQAINVLRGDMSIIGPRPDSYEHAQHYIKHIPGYAERHHVRPGIGGLAQTEVGYVEGTEATRRKVNADLYNIRNRSLRLELFIVLRSFVVIVRRSGT